MLLATRPPAQPRPRPGAEVGGQESPSQFSRSIRHPFGCGLGTKSGAATRRFARQPAACGRNYSTWMLAERATADHLSTSALMKAADCSGESPNGSLPSFFRLARYSCDALACFAACASRATMSGGVWAGAASPNHEDDTTAG